MGIQMMIGGMAAAVTFGLLAWAVFDTDGSPALGGFFGGLSFAGVVTLLVGFGATLA